jgi:hypothetical protein
VQFDRADEAGEYAVFCEGVCGGNGVTDANGAVSASVLDVRRDTVLVDDR